MHLSKVTRSNVVPEPASVRRPKPVVLLILDGWGHRDDPRDNALALADRDAAIMVRDIDAAGTLVDTMLATVSDEAKIAALGNNVSKMALRDAAERIVDEVDRIIKK